MEAVFLRILNMSLTGGYVILVILAARLLLRKAPKSFCYALWSAALFRLLCPVSFAGLFSLVPMNPGAIPADIAYAALPQIQSGLALVDSQGQYYCDELNTGGVSNREDYLEL